MPAYVYRGRSAYEWKPYLGPGVPRKTYRLCPLTSPISVVWDRWEELQTTVAPHTLEWLLREYAASREFRFRGKKPKSPLTIKEQERYLEVIVARPSGRGETFGARRMKSITPGVIRKYLDARLADGAGIAGNRERALISKAWSWAYARDMTRLKNPCIGVERNPEEPRKHYATDQDYEAWLGWLVEQGAPWYLPVIEEICYLCRARKIEALTMEKSAVADEGLDTLRRKGSKDGVTLWTERMRAVVEVAKAFEPGRFSRYLVTNTRGQPITVSAYNSSRGRLMRRAVADGVVRERFTVHDLKRKGATDSDLPATVSTGNSPSMDKIYDLSKLRAAATRAAATR